MKKPVLNEEDIIQEVRKKKEFSHLPVSIVERVLNLKEVQKERGKSRVKRARAILRKYYTVFLSNKLLKGKMDAEGVLKKHFSTKNRNYDEIYLRILSGNEKSIIDLGAGLNGFSFNYIKKRSPNAKYIGVEALFAFVELMNSYFGKKKLNGEAVQKDLFEINNVIDIIRKQESPKSIFIFNVIDALELDWNYSKEFLLSILEELGDEDRIVISFPTKSLSGKRQFKANRQWLISFLNENFSVFDDFETNGERFISVGKIE